MLPLLLSNINTILNAIGQNIADNKGVWTCGTVYFKASSASTTIGTGGGNSDLSCLVPTYIASGIPTDPVGNAADTKYQISTSTTGSVMVCAPNAAESAITGSSALCVIR